MEFKETYWNTDAAISFFRADNPERKIIQPKIAQEVIKCSPIKVLDYGCGDCFICSILPEDIEIDIFDKNKKLLDETHKKLSLKNVNKISEENDFTESKYDCILLSFVLLCIETKEEQNEILSLLFKALKKGGKLIITNSHPCFLQYSNSSFHTSYRPKCFNYLKNGEPYVVNIHQDNKTKNLSFIDYKWTLSFWINLMYSNGFKLTKMIEVKDEYYTNQIQNILYPPFLILNYTK